MPSSCPWRLRPDLSPNANARKLARDIVTLTTQDYVASIFVNDKLGKVPGALSRH